MNRLFLWLCCLLLPVSHLFGANHSGKGAHFLSLTHPDASIAPTLKVGYTAFFNRNYGHLLELGYYHMVDHSLVSYGPSVSLVGKIQNGEMVFGPKLGFETNLIMFDGKLDVMYLHPGFYIHPSVGVSLLGKAGLMLGYNICVNQKNASGFTIGLYYHISPTRKNGLNRWR
ncbi:MAG: hypothetical protein KL787_06790 [Taibaiella sp.]|nr:hypothetical protein [Taibaiella sp.]